MAKLISKQKTRLGPKHSGVKLTPGQSVHVPDDELDALLDWGRGGGRRLIRAGLLTVRKDRPRGAPPAQPEPKLDGPGEIAGPAAYEAAKASGAIAEVAPETFADLTVRKARPFIDACEDLDKLKAWAKAEADGASRDGIMDALARRFAQLGGDLAEDETTGAGDGTEGEAPTAGGDAEGTEEG